MSLLVELIHCKRCNAKIEVPPLPVIVGETAEQKAVRIGALEMATIMKHLTKAHPEARDHMIAWANVFSEFYFLAAFELKGCQMLQDRYDAQRLLLLGLCQWSPPEDFDFSGYESNPEAIANLFEENQRIAELEAAGYSITRGFLGERSKVSL
jgi:hypothetical protein